MITKIEELVHLDRAWVLKPRGYSSRVGSGQDGRAPWISMEFSAEIVWGHGRGASGAALEIVSTARLHYERVG
jgi:hypothetical protein